MTRALLRSLLAAAVAVAPGFAMAQDNAAPSPKLPAMPSLAKDNGDMSKPAGALPPPKATPKVPEAKPAPKSEERKQPELVKKGETKKGEAKKAEAKAKGASKVPGKHVPARAKPSHAAGRHAAAKPHPARRAKKR